MPAHPSTPKTDHAAEGLHGASPAQEAPDGAPARSYDNTGNGLSAVSGQNYNTAHGRKANAPVSGGDRHAAYDALLSPKTKS